MRAQLASFFDVSTATIKTWKHEHAGFLPALKRGKDEADATVTHSLYRRAVGDADHLPDTAACIFWLKNRRRDLWRDRMDSTVKVVREVTTMTDDKLQNVIRRGRSNGSGNGVAEPEQSHNR